MKEKNAVDITLHLTRHMLLGGLVISFITGLVILPNLLAKIGAGSSIHPAIWVTKSISFILIAGWLFMLAFLVLSSIAMKEIENIQVTQRSLEISIEALQMNLERMKDRQEKTLLQQTRENTDHREENDPAVIYRSAGNLTGKSDSLER